MANPIEDLPNEIWKPVVGWESLYEVSSHGRVRSVGRTREQASIRGSRARVRYEGRLLKAARRPMYFGVSLSDCGYVVPKYVHALVLEAFVGPRPSGMVACHNDGDSGNNHADNLRWDTPAGNEFDKNAHGTMLRGEAHPNSKLTPEIIAEARARNLAGETQKDIAAALGFSRQAINDALNGRRWKHLQTADAAQEIRESKLKRAKSRRKH